jgi:hypothetical protein
VDEVEMATPLGVDETEPRTAHIETVKPQSLEGPGQLWVDELRMQTEIFAVALPEHLGHVERHGWSSVRTVWITWSTG